jgi:hypothetical protein
MVTAVFISGNPVSQTMVWIDLSAKVYKKML